MWWHVCGGQKTTSGAGFHLWCLRQGLWFFVFVFLCFFFCSVHKASWLSSFCGFSCLCLPSLYRTIGITEVHVCNFMWVLGIWIHDLVFLWQATYTLSYFPSPMSVFLMQSGTRVQGFFMENLKILRMSRIKIILSKILCWALKLYKWFIIGFVFLSSHGANCSLD